ncbi:MAG: hypothetical protein J5856_04755 [Lachnospiraceae bacterium]|nr:hypothetical protein [Lachnospiraceae bacterium]
MIHLYTQNTSEGQNVTAPFSKIDNDSRIIKSSETAAMVTSGSNYLSLYSNQSDILGAAENGDLKFDVRNNLDYLTVMSNTMSREDFNRMMDEGAKPGDTDGVESITTLDKIKAKMAESGMMVRGYNDDLSLEVIEEITGSRGAAEALKKEFGERDLSLNEDNIENISEVYKKASEITEITDGMCDYILRNAVEPTVENLYRVRFCAAEVPFKEGGYFADEYGHIVKDAEGDFGNSKYFEEKIHDIAKKIDIEDPDEEAELLKEGNWLVKSRILCNERNLSILHELRKVSLPLSDEKKAAAVANALERGVGASEAELTQTDNLLKRAVSAKEVIDNATDSDLQTLINEGKVLNIRNLSEVQGSNVRTLNEGIEDPALITSKRILAETRLRMSVEANYMMIKRGFSIEITALEETVNVLKALEDKVNREFFGNDPVKAENSAKLWNESKQVIAEMPYLPARAIADVSKNSDIFSLRLTYEIGVGLKEQFDKAQKTYEAVGTEVRSDLGDDIKKAFSNIDDILKEQGVEINENNRKAVRILGYGEIEITKENIIDISEKESMLNRIINKMNPSNTLNLIREGINPLEIGMEELEARLDDLSRDSLASVDSYASFICKLDRAGEISEEERESFIGIYRLLDKIDKSDGKAVGELVRAEAEISFKNLLTALRTGKSRGLNVSLDESVGEAVRAAGYEFDISEQIASAFNSVIASEEGEAEYRQREFEAYKENLVKDEKNAANELEFLNEKVTPENLRAMGEILANEKDYNPWKKMEELADKLEDNEFKAVMDSVADSFEDEEKVKEAYENVIKEASDAIGRIAESGIADYFDIKAMKQTFRQIGLVSKMTREENYEVPLNLEDETVNIRVKILRKAEKEGKVFTSFETEEFGRILAQFTVSDGVLSALVAGENGIGLEKLKEKSDFEESFKNAGFEEVTFNYIQTDIINVDYFRQHFDKAGSDETTTRQLYNIAKTFIQTVKKAGSNL